MQIPTEEGENGTGSDGIWRYALISSPWWDCPVFEYLLRKPAGTDDRNLVGWEAGTALEERDPHHSVLEREFLNKWEHVSTAFPMRRFANGDAVLPITQNYFREKYGDKAMEWNIGNEADEADEVDGAGEADGAEGLMGLANIPIQDTNDVSRGRETTNREMDVPVDGHENLGDGNISHDSSDEDQVDVADYEAPLRRSATW
ncbi:hypothetical protein NW752_012483 [Fusarium irregulare]|uniref:Uncharacterized protein n=1 Tax=Fusarium irregulare TaxID=2494466 RepID=A0A9W8Q133_9HYPO|nr:hypothetical protein NW752_012483 [Fusarium irregulare]KAJ4023786.1 hypothetical protein NW766_000008 [Fusarium irregulare]